MKIIYLIICCSLLYSASPAQEKVPKNLSELLKKYNTDSIPYISVSELSKIYEKTILLDAREPKEYQVSHIKNAECVGYDYFNIDTVLKNYPNKTQNIVVYCSLGIRSEDVAIKLKKAGYTAVYNLYGGIFEWKNNDMDVVDINEKPTKNVHVFSEAWGKWLKKGRKVVK